MDDNQPDNQPSIKIFVSTHKPSCTFASEIMRPIHVGAARSSWDAGAMLRDDAGDNISELNPSYCELTAQYWAWKNEQADWFGFCHYRRYFDFGETPHKVCPWGAEEVDEFINPETQVLYSVTDEAIRAALADCDVITSQMYDTHLIPDPFDNVVDQFDANADLRGEDLVNALGIVSALYPDYAQDAVEFAQGHTMCLCNMFVMRAEMFDRYCAWLFPVLEMFCQVTDMSGYSKEGLRTPGHIAERLLNVFVNHEMRVDPGLRVKRKQVVLYHHPETPGPLEPEEAGAGAAAPGAADQAGEPDASRPSPEAGAEPADDMPPAAIGEGNPLRRVVDPLLPAGSRRREAVKALARKVRCR